MLVVAVADGRLDGEYLRLGLLGRPPDGCVQGHGASAGIDLAVRGEEVVERIIGCVHILDIALREIAGIAPYARHIVKGIAINIGHCSFVRSVVPCNVWI